jgi:hypothetical protein
MCGMPASRRLQGTEGRHIASYSAHMSPHPISAFVLMLEASRGEK